MGEAAPLGYRKRSLAKQRVDFGERLLDGRIQIASQLQPGVEVVADVSNDLREGRAVRRAIGPSP